MSACVRWPLASRQRAPSRRVRWDSSGVWRARASPAAASWASRCRGTLAALDVSARGPLPVRAEEHDHGRPERDALRTPRPRPAPCDPAGAAGRAPDPALRARSVHPDRPSGAGGNPIGGRGARAHGQALVLDRFRRGRPRGLRALRGPGRARPPHARALDARARRSPVGRSARAGLFHAGARAAGEGPRAGRDRHGRRALRVDAADLPRAPAVAAHGAVPRRARGFRPRLPRGARRSRARRLHVPLPSGGLARSRGLDRDPRPRAAAVRARALSPSWWAGRSIRRDATCSCAAIRR